MSEAIKIQIIEPHLLLVQLNEVKNHSYLFELMSFLKKDFGDSILEMVPTYRELAVYFHQRADVKQIKKTLEKQLPHPSSKRKANSSNTIYHLPVCYALDKGLDLERMAKTKGLSTNEIIEIHVNALYHIHFIGFLPGFPYLSGLDQRLHQPRLKNPRSKIPKGAVGIAEGQTGVYPIASPGGWNIIGQTPVELFSKQHHPPAVFQAGHQLRFETIDRKEFEKIEQAVKKGEYKIQTSNG